MPPDYSSPDPDPSQSPIRYPASVDDTPVRTWGARKRTPCELCGITIVQRMSGTRRFCSQSCSIRGRHGLPPLPKAEDTPEDFEVVRVQETTKNRTAECQECGAEFMARDYAAQRFCSGVCAARCTSRERYQQGGFLPTKPVRGVELPCLACGKAIYRTQGSLVTGRGQYCSRTCHHKALRVSSVAKVCPQCGKDFAVPPSKVEQTHCSHRCQKTALIVRPLGRMHNGRPARINRGGYIMLWEPDHTQSFHGWVPEHRLVLEKKLGRLLDRSEACHHVNGDKLDNRPGNLVAMNAKDHAVLSAREHRDAVKAMQVKLVEQDAELAALRAFKARHDAANANAPD